MTGNEQRRSLPVAGKEQKIQGFNSQRSTRWSLPADTKYPSKVAARNLSPARRCLSIRIDDVEQDSLPVDEPEAQTLCYTRREKLVLIWLVSAGAILSPLSSNIYFPALVSIAEYFHTTDSVIALSITVYMIFQGLAPSFWGPLADSYGRRPILLATLCVHVGANIALARAPNLAVLMVFRGIQAAGSSSTIALGAGVISDISLASERGGLYGIFSGVRMMGQALGPVIGGAFSQYLGFRSIFYFLFGFSSVILILLTVFLPETLPRIAGRGDVKLRGIYRPLLLGNTARRQLQLTPEKRALSFRPFIESFKMLGEKDVCVTLLFGGIIYTCWSMVTSSTTSLFKEEYSLNDVQTGLVYLPNGLGCVLGSYFAGRQLDWDYARTEREFEASKAGRHNRSLSCQARATITAARMSKGRQRKQRQNRFPIIRARLRSVIPTVALFVAAISAYGWTTETHVALPLTLQFIIAFTAATVFTVNSTLLIDLFPTKAASATAINNLMRCSLGALGVGVIEKMIERIDEGWSFSILGMVSAISSLLLLLQWHRGEKWITERIERDS